MTLQHHISWLATRRQGSDATVVEWAVFPIFHACNQAYRAYPPALDSIGRPAKALLSQFLAVLTVI